MAKQEITIVIPSIVPLEEVTVYQSFLESNESERFYVQFVFLRNGKDTPDESKAITETHDTHEVLRVPNDRFFGSCEENMYRMQDFVGLFKPLVFLIGNDDLLDWDLLAEAVAMFHEKRLDVLGWQFLARQCKTDGGHSTLPLLMPLVTHGLAGDYLSLLLSGEALESRAAYMAILSICGPLYWPPYIGNHLFSKAAFGQWLQYEFDDPVYSHLYKQTQFFTDYRLRYGFLNKPVVQRLGSEFMLRKQGRYPWGRLAESRAVHGKPTVEQMPYIWGNYQLEGDALFNAVIHSVGTSNIPTDDEEQTHGRYFFFSEICSWIRDAIRHKLDGKSHYFPDRVGNGSLQDIRYSHLFLQRVEQSIARYPALYALFTTDMRRHLSETVAALRQYLMHADGCGDMLRWAHDELIRLEQYFTVEMMLKLNRLSYSNYVREMWTPRQEIPYVEA